MIDGQEMSTVDHRELLCFVFLSSYQINLQVFKNCLFKTGIHISDGCETQQAFQELRKRFYVVKVVVELMYYYLYPAMTLKWLPRVISWEYRNVQNRITYCCFVHIKISSIGSFWVIK